MTMTRTLLMTVLPCIIILQATAPVVISQLSPGTTVFSDDFESYSTGLMNSPDYPCIALPDGSSTCQSPPHFNNGVGNYPDYWRVASNGNECLGQGGSLPCYTWSDNPLMGADSVFSVVKEQSHSGKQSLKLGVSDYAYDKTEAAVWLCPQGVVTCKNSTSAIPSGSTVSYSFYLWMGNGVNLVKNDFLLIFISGAELRYNFNEPGVWGYQPGGSCDNPPQKTTLGTSVMTSGTWHSLNVTVNLGTGKYVTFMVDGREIFPQIDGQPSGASICNANGGSNKPAYIFGLWLGLGAQGCTAAPCITHMLGQNQSIAYKGLDAWYAYLNDFQIQCLTCKTPVSITEFPVGTMLLVASLFIVAIFERQHKRKAASFAKTINGIPAN